MLGWSCAAAEAGVATLWQHRNAVLNAKADNGHNLLRVGGQNGTERWRPIPTAPVLGEAGEILLARQHGRVAQQLPERLDQRHQPASRESQQVPKASIEIIGIQLLQSHYANYEFEVRRSQARVGLDRPVREH